MVIEKPLYRYSSLDSGALCKLFREPDCYIPSADDHTQPKDIMRFIDNALSADWMFVLGRNPRTEAFIFAPSHNATTYMAHFAVRKDCRDGSVVRKTAEAGKWVFENTTCKSVIAYMREDNLAARSVLGQLGMKQCGRIAKSVLFDGELRDELIYQATIEDFNRLWGGTFGEV